MLEVVALDTFSLLHVLPVHPHTSLVECVTSVCCLVPFHDKFQVNCINRLQLAGARAAFSTRVPFSADMHQSDLISSRHNIIDISASFFDRSYFDLFDCSLTAIEVTVPERKALFSLFSRSFVLNAMSEKE
mmetsp:Transcript_22993/g.48068  ORF Transcript_22993/g.48068 Transcript_22993/m.48068 type:complete len:131 (-) Transcript_22993:1050-1442(-)